MRSIAGWVVVLAVAGGPSGALGDDGPMVKLLKSGKVPEERKGTIVEMIGRRGGPDDLAYLFREAARPDGFAPAVRVKALDALAEAAATRKARPSPGAVDLPGLIASADPPTVRLAAIRLAGLWGESAAIPTLLNLARSSQLDGPTRDATIDALASIGGPASRVGLEGLDAVGTGWSTRARAVAGLARFDLDAAADRAAALLHELREDRDPSPVLAALLDRRGGPEALGAALGRAGLSADAAKLTLRGAYAIGHAEPSLVAVLSKAAGLDAEAKPLDAGAMATFVADVAAQGDPARGEAIFRRADLNCTSCHALAGAGGGVGPDLSSVGASSPVDYLVNSILLPDQAIKEVYQTLIVQTADGQVVQGIVVDKDADRIILRDAAGLARTIPTAEVEESKEGGSLMPKGLSTFLTRPQLVDLVRFLSELGKPGPYAIRATPTVQRWRYLPPDPGASADPGAFRDRVLNAEPARWLPVYARVDGRLSLADLARPGPIDPGPAFLQAEVDVSATGPIEFRVDPVDGVRAWVDAEPARMGDGSRVILGPGRHALTIAVDDPGRPGRTIRVEVVKPLGATTEYAVVGGR